MALPRATAGVNFPSWPLQYVLSPDPACRFTSFSAFMWAAEINEPLWSFQMKLSFGRLSSAASSSFSGAAGEFPLFGWTLAARYHTASTGHMSTSFCLFSENKVRHLKSRSSHQEEKLFKFCPHASASPSEKDKCGDEDVGSSVVSRMKAHSESPPWTLSQSSVTQRRLQAAAPHLDQSRASLSTSDCGGTEPEPLIRRMSTATHHTHIWINISARTLTFKELISCTAQPWPWPWPWPHTRTHIHTHGEKADEDDIHDIPHTPHKV